MCLISGGEIGIRTLGDLRHDGFQDRSVQPLWHLSKMLFNFFIQFLLETLQKNGSPDWIRTSDQTINSRLLYRWATEEYIYFKVSEKDFIIILIKVKYFLTKFFIFFYNIYIGIYINLNNLVFQEVFLY